MAGIQGIIKGYSDRFLPKADESEEEVLKMPNDSGKVIKLKGKTLAIYKDKNGAVLKKSAVCMHRGCIVGWNNGEQTWDCPCHGSRYNKDGSILQGPTEKPLENAE